MKKILLLIDSLGPGGAQRQLVGLAANLKHEGHDVRVVAYFDIPFYQHMLDENGVEYDILKVGKSFVKRFLLISKVIKTYRPDVVVSYLDFPNIMACCNKAIGGKWKLIVSERNTTQILSIREKAKFKLYKLADYIVPNSHTQEKFIHTFFPNYKDKLVTITNYVDTDYFSPKENTEKDNNTLNILVIGRVINQKNAILFIKAIRKLKDEGLPIHVEWYGHKYGDYYKQCIDYLQSCNLETTFVFNDPVKDIVEAYRKADVFCLPSIYEGFPNVICEAMSCGLPILCSNVCDNPYIVKHGVNGYLFNPHDIKDMCKMIKTMYLLNHDELEEMKINNRKRAIDLFSQKAFVKKYEDIINNL